MYLYPFSGTGLAITVPNWVFEKGNAEGMRLLADPAVRVRLKREVAAGSMPGWSNFVTASGGWGGVILGNAYNPKYDGLRGLSMEEIGAGWDAIPPTSPGTSCWRRCRTGRWRCSAR